MGEPRGHPRTGSLAAVTDNRPCAARQTPVPGLTACSLCAGETLGANDTLDGGQLTRLRELETRGIIRLTLSECLDECERGDVVVVRPGSRQTARAPRPVWFERLAGDALTHELGHVSYMRDQMRQAARMTAAR